MMDQTMANGLNKDEHGQLDQGNSLAYKYAKLANHTEVKNQHNGAQAAHLNRTLNSRKFKNQSN